jgi:hypothetical protein
MSSLGREAIWSAFFALLSPSLTSGSGGPFKTVTRRAKPYTQTSPGEQPSLMVLQRRETADAKDRGKPTIWKLHGSLYVYAQNPVDGVAPGSGGGQVLNPLIDAIEAALAPVPAQGQVQSLGGLVSRAFIDGEVEMDEGNIDNQAVAIIPVTIIGPV